MKYLVIILFVLFTNILIGQAQNLAERDSIDTISVENGKIIYKTMNSEFINLPLSIDSVIIAYGVFYNEELSGIESIESSQKKAAIPTKERGLAISWKEAKLTNKEISIINKYLKLEDTYRYTYSILDAADIYLYYYKDMQIICRITISSITRDLTISQNEWLIYNSINSKFEDYITNILRKKKIWTSEKAFFKFD